MIFEFDEEKNKRLFEIRGVTFQDAIESINEKGILADFKHPNTKKYSNQRILVVDINKYAYCVPYVENKGVYFLKTVFPDRKFKDLLEENS